MCSRFFLSPLVPPQFCEGHHYQKHKMPTACRGGDVWYRMGYMAGIDEKFMKQAIALAVRGLGSVEPNPMVAAIIVRDGRELARGWHGSFGGPHAEIEALQAAAAAGADVRGATMYVTLEPCCHQGKTPPCTDALIAAGISRVVAAMTDPDENVAGGGVRQLQAAGIEVSVGCMEAEARKLLKAYIKLRTKHQPWVICKWAQTADGYLALPPGEGRWVTGELSLRQVHEIRSYCDGICVGIETVLADDPFLTNRSGHGKQPARVVLDSRLRIPQDCQLVKTAGQSPLIVVTTPAAVKVNGMHAGKLKEKGVELLALAETHRGVDAGAVLDEFGRRQWTYLLVEGGPNALDSFIKGRLADELVVFRSPRMLGIAGPDSGKLPKFDIVEVLQRYSFTAVERKKFGEDDMVRYLPRQQESAGSGRG